MPAVMPIGFSECSNAFFATRRTLLSDDEADHPAHGPANEVRMNRLTAILLMTLAVAACGNHGSGAPAATVTSPTAPTPATPSSTGVRGSVSDTAFRPLDGARVEVVDGPQAGMSTTADANGSFSLSGTFDDATRFRATKDGHVAATQVSRIFSTLSGRNVTFSLEVLAPPVNMAGDYTLTFIADSACVGLPDAVRTRTYAATITPWSSTSFNVALSGASFLPARDSFPIGVAGDYLTFWFADPALVEQIAANTQVELYGWGGASVGTSGVSRIAVSWEGEFEYSQTECKSKNHQLILARR